MMTMTGGPPPPPAMSDSRLRPEDAALHITVRNKLNEYEREVVMMASQWIIQREAKGGWLLVLF